MPTNNLTPDLSDRERAIQLGVLAAGALALVALVIGLQPYWWENPTDFIVYWEAGERMRAGGMGLYDEPADPMNKVGVYIYPPAFAALFAPLTMLPRGVGFAIWAVLQLMIAAFAVWAVRGWCGVRGRDATMQWMFFAALAIFGPLAVNIIEGQVNLLLVGLMAAGLWLDNARRPLRGGLLLALAVHIKILPLVLLPVLVLQRRWRACAGMLLGLGLFYFLPMAWLVPAAGPADGFARNHDLMREYAQKTVAPQIGSRAAPDLGGSRIPNNSLAAVSARWLGEDALLGTLIERRGPLLFAADERVVRWSGPMAGGCLYLLTLVFAWRRRQQPLARAAAAGLAFVAASMGHLLFWMHHLVVVLMLMGPLGALALRASGGARKAWVASAFAMVLLVNFALFDPTDWMLVLGMPTFGVLVVWVLTLSVFWRERRDTREIPEISATLLPHEKAQPGNLAA